MRKQLKPTIMGAAMLALCAGTGMAATLDEIKARGSLTCGIPAGDCLTSAPMGPNSVI